jgi:DNA-binding LytR/AlgR family response regulator
MRIRIEVDESLAENEIILRCSGLSEEIIAIQRKLGDVITSRQQLAVTRGDAEYYLVLDEILFFETAGAQVAVHTADQIFGSKYKLYELEEMLPGSFMRVSKSTIINVNKIRAVHKNITGASEVEFANCHKKAFVSRSYYKALETKLEEKRLSR